MKQSILTITLALAALLAAAPPDGWRLTGQNPADYETGVDAANPYNSRPSAFLKSKTIGEGFATLMQPFSATQYRGKRVRFSAWVKSENLTDWAGLWMRIDGPAQGGTPPVLAFDNMENRSIKGTTPWTKYDVVLDVPQAGNTISIGILQGGPGQVWMNSAEFAVVGPATTVTGAPPAVPPLPDAPRNLTLDK
jgi:hypothetical protein